MRRHRRHICLSVDSAFITVKSSRGYSEALPDCICEWFYGPALNGCFVFSLSNVAVNCTMDSEALSHRAPRGGWMGMRMLFTKSSQPSAHWWSDSPNIYIFFHLIFYDTSGNYCHLRLSSIKRAMSSSADRRGFVVVWFYYLSSAIRLHAIYVSQSILHHFFSVHWKRMFKSYKFWRNSTSIGIDLCVEI